MLAIQSHKFSFSGCKRSSIPSENDKLRREQKNNPHDSFGPYGDFNHSSQRGTWHYIKMNNDVFNVIYLSFFDGVFFQKSKSCHDSLMLTSISCRENKVLYIQWLTLDLVQSILSTQLVETKKRKEKGQRKDKKFSIISHYFSSSMKFCLNNTWIIMLKRILPLQEE